MPVKIASALLLSLLLASAALAAEAKLPRHPAPSPDGSQILFSWQGDLWLVASSGGQARRLTAHPATERHPVWSRDGRLIAFSSDRHGNADVFVLPTDGSEPPRRLTFASEDDIPADFTPEGDAVLFASGRAEGVRWMPELWTVPVEGGTPALAQEAFGESGAWSPDGGTLAFVRGATEWTRRGYRGSNSRDLWLRDPDGGYVQLTDFDGTDDRPTWVDANTLVFLSDRDGRKNVHSIDVASGATTPLTHHDGSDVRFPRVSSNGSLVAYEFEDALWTVRLPDGSPTRLQVEVPADEVQNPVERRTATDGADELAVSPDGKVAAFVLGGDVFVTGVASEEDQKIATPPTIQVTETPEREEDLSWSPDGKSLLFTSARGGNVDVYLARRAEEETPWAETFDFPVTRLTAGPAVEHLARFSPDGQRVAFVRGKGELVTIPTSGGEETVLLRHWDTPDYAWSPDGAWIAYATGDRSHNSEVWIVDAAGGEPYNVSRHPDNDLAPRWSPDGRRLVWVSKRHADTFDVWGVWLTRADDERRPAEWLALWKKQDEAKGKEKDAEEEGGGEEEQEKAPELPKVTIDFDRLWERVAPITTLQGDESAALVSPDGRTVVFTAEHEGERDLYKVRWDGDELERLTEDGAKPRDLHFDPEGETVFYLDGKGVVQRVGLDGEAGDAVPFSARLEVDRRLRRQAVFDETWRALDEYFYDPGFHGVDWAAEAEKYRPWALEASTDADFADVLNLMLGELNSSHMGYYPPGTRGPGPQEGDRTGWLGVTFDPAAGGPGVLIHEVLPDSPAARVDVALRPGDRLLSVNGVEIGEATNVFSLFVDTVGRRTPVTLRSADGEERRVVVTPVDFDQQQQLRYSEWVRERRRLTEELSEGRLGYLHIESMNIPSFEEFERSLFAAAHGKEGLVIDVRSNGGGWTTDYLMAALMVRRHAYTVPRDADPEVRGYPQERLPLAAWTRPAVALCNEDSYSNAEIFSHAFKELGRGTLVGTPTFGAVISTGGTRVLDGALVRQPWRGWYVASTGLNMETSGAQPDVIVRQPPVEDHSATEDTQLRRAVEVLLANLESDPRAGAW